MITIKCYKSAKYTLFLFFFALIFSANAQFDRTKYSDPFDFKTLEEREFSFLPQKSSSQPKTDVWWEPDTVYTYSCGKYAGVIWRHHFPYNKDGKCIAIISQRIDSVNVNIYNRPYRYYRYNYIYDNNNNLLERHNQFSDDDGVNWYDVIHSMGFLYTYDANNNLTSSIQRWRHPGEWQNDFLDTYQYDLNNNLIELIIYWWSGQSEQWEIGYRTTYIYNLQNQCIFAYHDLWRDNVWVNENRYCYTYNTENLLTELAIQRKNIMDEWVTLYQSLYEYDTQNRLIEHMYHYYQTYTRRWLYTYDVQNNKISELYQSWMSYQWQDERQELYTYDSQNNLLEVLAQKWSGESWQYNGSSYFTYDSNNNAIAGSGSIMMYYNNMQSSIQWSNDSFSPEDVCGFTASYVRQSHLNDIPEEPVIGSSVKLYPNPVSATLYIETGTDIIPTVKLYSIQGALLLEAQENSINLSSLSNGIYIVKVNGERYKIIKQ